MASSADVSAIVGYAGKYEKQLIRRAVNSFDVADKNLLISNIKNKTTLTKIIVNGQIKPYTGDFVAEAGDLDYEPRTFTVDKWQRDIVWDPDDYRDTYQQDMRGPGENANNKTIPFAEYAWNTILSENMAQLNDVTSYFGVGKAAFAAYNAGTNYTVGSRIVFNNGSQNHYYRCVTATTAGQTPLTHASKWVMVDNEAVTIGFKAQLATEISNGKITPVVTGAVDSTTAYAAAMAVWRKLPVPIRSRGGEIQMSYTDYDLLLDDYENKVSKNFETIDGITFLAKTDRKCIITPATWMTGSRRLIATARRNFSVIVDLANDGTVISAIPDVYKIKTGMSAVVGFGIRDIEALAVSDQA